VKRIGIYEAKTHLSQLCEETATTGESWLISKNGKPLVKIVPYRDADHLYSVWDTVEEAKARYGPLEDIDMPDRECRSDLDSSVLDED
jgi:prevent-host-death family protein